MTAVADFHPDAAAAERRAERIRLRLDAIADNYAAVLPLIREAIAKRDDVALGYRSVGEYVADRFGGALHNLGIEVRREVVRELTAAGMSTRAIAPVVGASQKTVDRDARQVSHVTHLDRETGEVPAGYPEPPSTHHVQGEVTSSSTGRGEEEAAPEARVEPSTPPAAAPRPPVVGLDGKTYTTPERRTPARRPLVDDARDAGQELRKAIERVERLAADDRLSRNKNEVAAHLRHHLDRALTVCQDLSDYINQ